MTKRLLAGAVLLPLFASADTLILKNGTRYRGNFNSANANQISFTEYSGNRQNLNRSEVQELRFGNDQDGADNNNNSGNNRGFGRDPNGGFNNGGLNSGRNNGNSSNQPVNSGMADDLNRLQQDLQTAMDNNNNLSSDQRQSLDDSRATLSSASDQSRNGRQVDQRSIRLALDSIRNAASRMQSQDRDRLNEDIRRISASAGSQGRNY